jgi:surface antigen
MNHYLRSIISMKKILSLIVVFLCSASLMGCQNMSKQDVGVLSGGVAGGLLGSTIGGGTGKILAVAAGAVAGAMIGGSIGRSMDDNDRMQMNAALNNNSVGQPAYWQNANSGASYKVVPVKNVSVEGNKYCREYRTMVDIAGKQQQMYGTACRQPDGTWKAVK